MVDQVMRVEIINSLKLSKAGVDWVHMVMEQGNKVVSSRIFSSCINNPFSGNGVESDAFRSECLVKIEVCC